MSILPDSGNEFWEMFPHDENGDVVIEEIDLDKYADLEPDPEIVVMMEAENKKISAA